MCPDNNNKGSGRGSDSSSWMTAAALAGSAAFFVGKAMFKGAKWAGGAISDNTRTLYNTIIDDKQKFDEIKRIEAYCTEIKENLEKEQAWRERSMNIEAAHYGELCRKVQDNLQSAQKYKLYYDENQDAVRIENRAGYQPLEQSVSLSGLNVAGVSLSKGGIAGAAAGGGAAALMAALGTASTGTAIASLSGAAFTNALLASFGGGSIASGGLGIAGGTVVLGSIITIPALAVGGYMVNKQVNKAYQDAKECEEKARIAEAEGTKLFQHYDEGIQHLKKINRDFDRFSTMFGRIINLSMMAASYPKIKPSYNRLLNMSIDIAAEYMNISLVDEKGHISRDITEKIAYIPTGADECYKRLILLEENMTPEEERLANSVPNVISATYEVQIAAYVEEIKRLKETTRQQDITIKENNKIIRHKDRAIQEKDEEISRINRALEKEREKFALYAESYSQKLNEALEAAACAKSEEERIRQENEAIKADRNRLMGEFPTLYQERLKHAKESYSNIRSNEMFAFIATAELYHSINEGFTQGDFSCIAVEYAKAVEVSLYEVIAHRLDARVPKRYALGELKREYVEPKACLPLWKDGIKWGLLSHLEALRILRNASAHKEIIDKERMQKARTIVLGGGRDPLTKHGLLAYFDGLLK